MEHKNFDFGQIDGEASSVHADNDSVQDDFYADLNSASDASEKADTAPQDDFWAGFEAAKKAAAEEASKLAAEEAAKKAAEEAAAKKISAEEQRKAELEAARKAAEEAKRLAEKAAAEAEAARKAEEETKKRIAEEAARKAAEEEARRKAEEEARKAAEEAAKKAAEEAARKAAEEEARKKAEEEAAKKAAEEEAKKAAEEAAKKAAEEEARKKAEAKAAKKKSGKKASVPAPEKTSNPPDGNEQKGINTTAVIIAAVFCVLVIAASFIVSKMLFGGSEVSKMSGSEQSAYVEQQLTEALQAANVGITFSVSGARLSIANEEDYVVFFKDKYSLYKMTGSYSKDGLSNSEKISEAGSVKTSADSAELLSSCVTSYFVNTKDIDNKTVTLSVKITDNDGQEFTTNKPVAVNVVSSAAAPTDESEEGGTEGETGTEEGETGTEGETGNEEGGAGNELEEGEGSAGTEGGEDTAGGSEIEAVPLASTYQVILGTLVDVKKTTTDTFSEYQTSTENGEVYAGAVDISETGSYTVTYEKGSSISEGQIHVLLAEIYGILEEDYTVDQIVISNVKLLLDDAEVEINQDNVSIIDYYAENTHTLRISLFNEYGSDEEKGENAAVDAAALSCDNGKISISFDLTLAEE